MRSDVMFYLAVILLGGLLAGRAVKYLKLPNVTGYLLAGLLLGPYVFGVLPSDLVLKLDIIPEIALAFIAFIIGSEFKYSYFKQAGLKIIVIALMESLVASFVVFGALMLFRADFQTSIILAGIAAATAPAATVMVIKQYGAKGPLTKTLLSVVALDDAVALIAFGIAFSIVGTLRNTTSTSLVLSVLSPFIEIIGSLAAGIVLGLLFRLILRFFRKDSNRLIITTGFVFLAAALSNLLDLSSLLTCMALGAALVNVFADSKVIFSLADTVTPPIFLMFFVISGAQLDITVIPKIGVIGSVYLLARAAGKILGAWSGASIVKAPLTVKKYLGITLIPQAGVAIGLSLIIFKTYPDIGVQIKTVVLCATFVYEIFGPVLAKIGLRKSGEIGE